MSRNLLNLVVFALGLLAVCWIGVGYVGSNPLGAAVAAVIAACYLAGAYELYRYRQGTTLLAAVVDDAGAAASDLAGWLGRLPVALRNPVRLRIEGQRVAMPAPVLTPYLAGLLVLLGMLGTLLGMMATLRGTGLALESATDLAAIRGSLAAPVKGLGFAFGTSIAGVATSAMLGLLSALCRRERLLVVQRLDAAIATTLHLHSQAHQRSESFQLLKQQAEAIPLLADRLQAMMTALEQRSVESNERLVANQQEFHAHTEQVYQALAASVERSLKQGVEASARTIGDALQPVVETTMAGLVREAGALHGNVTDAVQRQLDGMSATNEAHAVATREAWNGAIEGQRGAHAQMTSDLNAALERFAATFESRSAQLLDQVSSRVDAGTETTAQAWRDALAEQRTSAEQLSAHNQQALVAATEALQRGASELGETMHQSQQTLQQALAERDAERLAAWSQAFEQVADSANAHWSAAAEQQAQRQQAICVTLENTAEQIAAQTQAHASETIAEISRLVQAASEAPKAAAEVVAELREKLSDSMARDTATLEERAKLLETVQTLLEAINHAATEQRAAVDALVGSSAELLDRVGHRFTDHVEAEAGKLAGVAAQITGSAVEVASLGEAFGKSVELYGQSNEALMERLQQVATALDGSLARSDEQLAYYVAQAREVVDLSVLSQKQIIDELQQLAGQATNGTTPA